MIILRKFFSLLFLFNCSLQAQDQSTIEHQDDPLLKSSHIIIRNFIIQGNKKTKSYIAARELVFQKNAPYSISDMLAGLQRSRQNLMNTALFVDANVSFTNWYNDSLDIFVDVKERWYYFPLPYLKPADRNWNVWLNDYGLNPDRLNYGLKFLGNNITGRNDKLNIWLINGYTQRATMKYYNPFSDNSLRHGWGFDVSYSRNREINHNTIDNKQAFYKDENKFIRKQVYLGGVYSYRKGSIARHYLRLGYQMESIADTVAALNSNYLGSSATKVSFPELRYTYQYYNVNYMPYPTKGKTIEIDFLRRGGPNNKVNLSQFLIHFGKYFPLPNKFYFSSIAEGHIRVPFDQPYFNQYMLGYNDAYLRGLEYYVVDGVAGGFVRNTVGKEFFSYTLKTGLRSKTYAAIPFKVYLKAYGDVGYVYNKNNNKLNMLNNKILYTGGIGLDIISIYDVVLRVEYSFNQLNQNGLFVHKADARN
jgi:outer membrane protein assembly factor BamA